MRLKLGLAFLIFWTPFFASIEYFGFHMTLHQVLIARTVAGIFNLCIGCYYPEIKRALGGARGMVVIKLTVTGFAYTTVILLGLAEFHILKLILKTIIATMAGLIAGKLGLFDLFYLLFDKVWSFTFRQKREAVSRIVANERQKVGQDGNAKKCECVLQRKTTRIRGGRLVSKYVLLTTS